MSTSRSKVTEIKESESKNDTAHDLLYYSLISQNDLFNIFISYLVGDRKSIAYMKRVCKNFKENIQENLKTYYSKFVCKDEQAIRKLYSSLNSKLDRIKHYSYEKPRAQREKEYKLLEIESIHELINQKNYDVVIEIEIENICSFLFLIDKEFNNFIGKEENRCKYTQLIDEEFVAHRSCLSNFLINSFYLTVCLGAFAVICLGAGGVISFGVVIAILAAAFLVTMAICIWHGSELYTDDIKKQRFNDKKLRHCSDELRAKFNGIYYGLRRNSKKITLFCHEFDGLYLQSDSDRTLGNVQEIMLSRIKFFESYKKDNQEKRIEKEMKELGVEYKNEIKK